MQKLRFHHVGIPTNKALPKEDYSEQQKMHATGYFDTPYGIEWMHFDADNNLPEIIKTMPHVAYCVDDLQLALQGKEIVLAPYSPQAGVQVAFILDGRNLIELLQFDQPEQEVWPHPTKFFI